MKQKVTSKKNVKFEKFVRSSLKVKLTLSFVDLGGMSYPQREKKHANNDEGKDK